MPSCARPQDILVANAALSAKAKTPAATSSGEEQAAIVATNLGGALLCAAAAMKHMQRQPGGGKVFLMDGAGRCEQWEACSAARSAVAVATTLNLTLVCTATQCAAVASRRPATPRMVPASAAWSSCVPAWPPRHGRPTRRRQLAVAAVRCL